MSALFEDEYQRAPVLCFRCAVVYARPEAPTVLRCPECDFSVEDARYRSFYRHAFYAARYGIQYRRDAESRSLDESQESKPHFCLGPLGELATFVALAIASGVLGNASWEAVRFAIGKIISQRERCAPTAREFSAEDIEKLIEYISDYEDDFSRLPPGVKEHIMEEIIADSAGDNPAISKRIGDLLFTGQPPTEAKKRQATILYRELARRARVRSLKRPERPAWKFWDRGGEG